MYYSITSITPQEVRLDLASKYINVGDPVFAFVFDNTKGAIKLVQDASEQSVAWIPYEEIDYFDIHKRTSSGSRGNQIFEVIMHLKSFASWPLFQHGHLEKAETDMSRLKAAIDLNKKSSFLDKPVFPSAVIAVTHDNGKTVLKWKNSSDPRDAVKLGFIGIAAGALLIFLLQMTFSQSIFGFLIVLSMFVIYLVIMYQKITTLMKDHKTRYGFSFNPNEIEYFEEEISTGRRKFSTAIPRANWTGLSYPNTAAGQDVILSIDGNPYQKYAALEKNKASVKDLYTAKRELKTCQKLRIKDLRPVERVNVVNWMTAEINKGR